MIEPAREMEENASLARFIIGQVFPGSDKTTHISITYTINGIPYINQDPKNISKHRILPEINLVLVHLFTRADDNDTKVKVFSARIHLTGDEKTKILTYSRELEQFCADNFGKGLKDVYAMSYPSSMVSCGH